MKLKIIGSGSSGNSYILHNDQVALIIECGLHWRKIQEALNFDLSKVQGCLVTHEHKDHCKAVDSVLAAGISVWSSSGTHKAMNTSQHHGARHLMHEPLAAVNHVGEFKVIAFRVQHDAVEPLGFLIYHPECGTVLFATDTYYLKQRFKGLNNVIIEANYCEHIIRERRKNGTANRTYANRVIESHMSIQQCIQALQGNDLSAVHNIVLIHLSDANSDAARFRSDVEAATGKMVHVASPGIELNFNKTPF